MEKRYVSPPKQSNPKPNKQKKKRGLALTAFPKRLEDVSNVGLFYVLMGFLGFVAGILAMVAFLS